jgi:DNA-binding beta-propeller fold protein YncE
LGKIRLAGQQDIRSAVIGEASEMKLGKISSYLALAVIAPCLLFSGCGSKTSAIVTSVSVTSSVGNTLILGQSTTITATVTGPSNTDVTWEPGQPAGTNCTYTTTTTSSSGVQTVQPSKICPTDGSFGTLSNEQTTGSATFLAPSILPDPTTYPLLTIIITVQAVADSSKHGLGTLSLNIDSGITVSLTPTTAAVPTSEKQPFFAILTNDLQNKGVTWSLTQSTPSSTTPTTPNIYAGLATCTVSGNASGCGSIDVNGVYTAPSNVPTVTTPTSTSTTPANVTIVATSVEDPTRYALGTITITAGGPITYNGITPTIAPQGAIYWDIYLNAPNISSASIITLTDANNGVTTLTSGSGQVKVLFPIPTGTVANPPSTGARVRLLANNLAVAGPVTISVTDPAETVTPNPAGTFTYNILPVRPSALYSSPADVLQGGATSGNIDLTIDGGYFGASGQLANVTFLGNTIPGTTNGAGQPQSYARRLDVQFPSSAINNGLPGLYPLSVSRTTPPLPFENNPAVTDLAVFPSYLSNPPTLVSSIPAGTNPSAIDIDPTLGVVVVAETGSNAVQFFSIGTGTLTPINGPVTVGKVPTGLSVNRTNHTVAVVNYQDQSVTVLPIPGAPVQAPGTPFTIDISGALQGQVSPAPLPYAIGVDPDTNMGVVAYSSTSASSAANLGFLVNLNTGANPYGCPASTATPQPTGPCLYAQVTLNSGAYPQIAMAPHGHLAFVTPGGSGALQGVDVTKSSFSTAINSLTLAAGIVTVITANTSTTNPPAFLTPGNSGTVLITGVPAPGTAGNSTTANFNGVFSVAAISDTSFTYIINSTASGSVTLTPDPNTGSTGAQVLFSSPNLIYGGLSQTTQGISINPVTNTAALADANATGSNGPQIDLINNLDQTISSISFFSTCTFYTTTLPCANGPELLGTADIAWQPYSNAIVSYNPKLNQVSVSDPVSARRYAFACNTNAMPTPCLVNPQNPTDQQTFNAQTTLAGTGTATLTVANGTTNSLTLFGGLAVDPVTNQAFVVLSGSGQIDVINLGPCNSALTCPNTLNSLKPTQITEILVPNPSPALGVIGGIPNATVPQGTLTSTTDLSGVQIFGSGFDAATQVRLDGTAIPTTNVQFVSNREVIATIPASYLSFPHRYALDAVNGSGVQSNATDFFVIQAVDLSKVCTGAGGVATNTQPSSVAIADQLANGPFSPIAVVTNTGCNSISVIDMNPTVAVGGVTQQNPNFGNILNSIAVGSTPEGIAISQPFGLAVVANNGDGTVSVVNLLTNSLAVPAVGTGTNPTGVAINDATGAAIVTNPGSNTVTEINLGLLFATPPATSLAGTPVSIGGFQQPTAVAIDPDRGTNNQGLAVVTELELVSGSAPQGALGAIDIGATTPILSTTAQTGSVTAPTTGIVFDPTVITGTANNGVFYASSSGGNVISSFNPDSGAAITVNVGINPTALAINPETGAILTTNLAGQTTSLVDTTSSPLKTVKTIGLPGSAQFGVAIDQFTNLAAIVDQANNRLLIFPMPN